MDCPDVCQAIVLLYNLPKYRRLIMEKAETGKFPDPRMNLGFRLAYLLFDVETRKNLETRENLEKKKNSYTRFIEFQHFMIDEKIPNEDIMPLFWRFLKEGKLFEGQWEDGDFASIELACFAGENGVKRVKVEPQGTLRVALEENSGSDYIIVLFKEKADDIKISDYANYDLLMAVQEKQSIYHLNGKLKNGLIGINGSSFEQDPKNARAVLLRKKLFNEEPLGELPEELHEKFQYDNRYSEFLKKQAIEAGRRATSINTNISSPKIPDTQSSGQQAKGALSPPKNNNISNNKKPWSNGGKDLAAATKDSKSKFGTGQERQPRTSDTKELRLKKPGRSLLYTLGYGVALVGAAALFSVWFFKK